MSAQIIDGKAFAEGLRARVALPARIEQALARAYDSVRNRLLESVQERIAHAALLTDPDAVPSDLKNIPTL